MFIFRWGKTIDPNVNLFIDSLCSLLTSIDSRVSPCTVSGILQSVLLSFLPHVNLSANANTSFSLVLPLFLAAL